MTLGASCGSQFQRACYIDAIVMVLFTVPSAVSNFQPEFRLISNQRPELGEIAHRNNHNNKTEYYHSEAL